MHLPLRQKRTNASEIRQIEQTLRDMRFNPDRYLCVEDFPAEEKEAIAKLISDKQHALQQLPENNHFAHRHQKIEQANQSLQAYLQANRSLLQEKLAKLKKQFRGDTIAFSREFPFCLFSEASLQNLLLDLASDRA